MLVQSPRLIICYGVVPLLLALWAIATLVECPLKKVLSIPAIDTASVGYNEMEGLETGRPD